MYTDPFVCDYDSTSPNTTQTFNRIQAPTVGQGSVYKNDETDAGTAPEWCKISHQVVGKGSAVRDRHLVRFELSSVDADDNVGTTAPAVAYAVFDIPRTNISATGPTVLARMLVGFLRGANADDSAPDYTTNFAKLMNGEG
jgi:hypothetical protein